MPSKMKYVTLSIHISVVLYAFLLLAASLAMFFVPFDKLGEDGYILKVAILATIITCGPLIAFLEIVVNSLKKGRYWSWIAAVIVTGFYIPSGYIMLGIFMLIGLMDEDVRDFCKKKTSTDSKIAESKA
jgi:hypothetical protein